MLTRARALAAGGVACLVAIALAGCGSGSSSSASQTAVTVSGGTLAIFLSEPADVTSDPAARDVVDAERLAFAADRGAVADFHLQLIARAAAKLSDNARAAILDPRTIAYVGEIAPGTSDQTVGITNALDVLELSPTDTALELTNQTPAVSGAPHFYYESWSTYGQTFARMVPSGLREAKALVAQMRSLHAGSLYVASDGSDYGRALADALAADARAAGLAAARSESAAGAIFYGAQSPTAAARFFDRAAALAPHARLFGSSSLDSAAFTAALSPAAAARLYVSLPGFMPRALTPAGRAFVARFRAAYGHTPNPEAIFGYAAVADLLGVLHRLGREANNRTAVIRALLSQRRVSSVLGTFSMQSSGNTTLDAFVFARVRDGRLVPVAAAPTA
ncbi:MAG TPA: ABC transporter substrate-binding protein [Solirubrobacteraceae bacterium]|nr:ABC transporter substrate-binding protein [Solirubrobacteraceae bacterium]